MAAETVVPTITIDVEDLTTGDLRRAENARIIVTDKKTGAGLVGSFNTKGLTLSKIYDYIDYLLKAAMIARVR